MKCLTGINFMNFVVSPNTYCGTLFKYLDTCTFCVETVDMRDMILGTCCLYHAEHVMSMMCPYIIDVLNILFHENMRVFKAELQGVSLKMCRKFRVQTTTDKQDLIRKCHCKSNTLPGQSYLSTSF